MTPARITRLLVVGGSLALSWAVLTLTTGGFGTTVFGLRVSSHDAARPLLVALILLGAATWRLPAAARVAALDRAAAAVERWAARGAIAAAVGVGAVAAVYGVHVACGADSYGYVSQSAYWRQGLVSRPVEVLSDAPWPDAGWLVAPLGYSPAREPGTLGYTYSPGVPWLMALLRIPFGDAGPYLVTPVLGALFVWLTFVYVRQRSAPAPALAAAVLVATSPPFLFQMMWSMSDVPGAALWLAALVRLPSPTVGHALVTGAVMAAALVVRPNLFLVAAALGLTVAALDLTRGDRRGAFVRLAAMAAPLVLAVAVIATLNIVWRGSPLASGYGGLRDIFVVDVMPRNARQQLAWLWETDSWVVLLGLVALPWLVLHPRTARAWAPGAAVALFTWVSYIGWGTFTEWWYLRFHLPGWPVLTGAGCVAAWHVGARRWHSVASLAVVLLALVAGLHGARLATTNRVFRLWWGEQRYVAAGEWLKARTPANAVVITLQHSGTVGYYGDRASVRYDYLAPDALEPLVRRLEAQGRPVYFLGEDWEEVEFRGRFGSGSPLGRLDWSPLAEIDAGLKVRMYALSSDPARLAARATERVPFDHDQPWDRLNAPDGSWLAPPRSLRARLAGTP